MRRVITLILSSLAMVMAAETLPPYHWANSYIDYFIVSGELQQLDKLQRPFDRIEVTKALLKLDIDDVADRREREMLRILLREFEYEGRQLSENGGGWMQLMNKAMQFLNSSGESNPAAFKAGALLRILPSQSSLTDSSSGLFELHPRATLSIGEMMTLHSHIRIFNEAPPEYAGKKFAGLYAYNEQAYLSMNTAWLDLKLGRDYLQSGPGEESQLLFSDNSRPFDMYHLRVGSSSINFSFWGMLLDDVAGANRYVNGHRLAFNIGKNYRFAVSEVIVYGGPNQFWDLGLMNPLMFYHGYNLNTTGFDANTFYNVEWDIYPVDNLEIYGEFLLDDYQIDKESPGDLEPNEWGILAGVKWARPANISGLLLNAEYTQVRNRTYNVQNNAWEKWLHRGEEIGHYLGNNFDRWFLQARWWARAELEFKLRTTYTRQGEGTVQGLFNTDFLDYTVEEGYDEPFPFGVVESDFSVGISATYRPLRWGHMQLAADWHNYGNLRHISGMDDNDLRLRAEIWLEWDYMHFNDK